MSFLQAQGATLDFVREKTLLGGGSLNSLEAATQFVDGAILIDEFDDIIFDDVLRRTIAWNQISKRVAPGDTTGGFEQSAIGNAVSANPRSLSFSAVSPTRAARVRRDIEAIAMYREFGMFDRSVAAVQARPFSDLQAKDVQDMVTGCLRLWNTNFYEGNNASDNTQFSGLRTLLNTNTTTVGSGQSVVRGIVDAILDMTNQSTRDVMPTAIYANAQVVDYIAMEYNKIGDRLPHETLIVGGNPMQVNMFPSPSGFLPIFADPFNGVISGTPNTYATFIVSEDKLEWQYIPPVGSNGAEPKTFEIAMTNVLNLQFTTVMFGALELLGGTNHHRRVNVVERTIPIDMTA